MSETAKRELISHRVNPANDRLKIEVLDVPGSGGASHLYEISGYISDSNPSDPFVSRYGKPGDHSTILFQNGPIAEVGVNGVTHEALIAILIDRLQAFQSGPYANHYNASALAHLEAAQAALRERTLERMNRGVEGTHQQ